MTRVLVIGGYGAFGSRVAERLARGNGLEIVIGGRDGAKAGRAAEALARLAAAKISAATIDATRADPDRVRVVAPQVVVNASGPFQGQDYGLARACIAAGCHYVDLADAASYVAGIGALDGAARAAGVAVISGASSVPGLSSAVVVAKRASFRRLESIDIAISPGNSFDPGLATTASVLMGLGRPIIMRTGGKGRRVYGWQSLRRASFDGLGRRWLANVDVPDLVLLPAHDPGLETVRFQAGTEVGILHLGMWGLSWLVRSGLLARPERLASPLLAVKRRIGFLGSDRGGMFVELAGLDTAGRSQRLVWTLVAGSGHGPYVPALTAVVLARRLARGEPVAAGARPCYGEASLDEIETEARGLDISMTSRLIRP